MELPTCENDTLVGFDEVAWFGMQFPYVSSIAYICISKE